MHLVMTLLIGLAGVAVFKLAHLPLPWLLGPMFACLIAALLRVRLTVWMPASHAMRTVLGIAIGATITPALLTQAGSMIVSVLMVPLFILCIAVMGFPLFKKVYRFDTATSYYAAMPGGLQDMLLFGEAAGGDVRALSLIHATRVLTIVATIPFVLSFGFDMTIGDTFGTPALNVPPAQLALMVGLALGGWWLAARIGLPGAAILGPMLLGAAASLAGMLAYRPPQEAIVAAQFFIGLGVGVKYVGISLNEIRRFVAAGLIYSLLAMVIGSVFAAAVMTLGIAPPLEAFLAFAPGGQAEMVILAIVTGADVAVVVVHHVCRLATVILGAPLLKRWFR
ncbi:AbrB family transcriptional regulator [Aestuariibius sp. 2305UL40-4]|uniref:AbrB family transcriptional regulator n=1 Tax=Aestuariibius violaceus TaxID=3234132 RepID=UPI00345E733F